MFNIFVIKFNFVAFISKPVLIRGLMSAVNKINSFRNFSKTQSHFSS